jgi:hypothetical protein
VQLKKEQVAGLELVEPMDRQLWCHLNHSHNILLFKPGAQGIKHLFSAPPGRAFRVFAGC